MDGLIFNVPDGLDDVEQVTNTIRVYPTLTRGTVQVHVPVAGVHYSIAVYNSLGQQVQLPVTGSGAERQRFWLPRLDSATLRPHNYGKGALESPVQRNYLQIRREVQEIVDSALQRMSNDPSLHHLIVRKG